MSSFAKALRAVFINILLFALLLAVPAPAADAARTVRVGWYTAAGMQDGADMTSLGGYNYEYLNKIAQYADWRLEFVFGSWTDLERELIEGRLDIIGDVGKSAARLKKYDYCDYPSGFSRMLMVCRQNDDRFAYNDYRSFDGITVADEHSAFRKSLLDREARRHGFHAAYKNYETEKELFAALDRGETDAAIFSNVSVYRGYKIISEWEPNPFYFVVSKKQPEVLRELNGAMRHIQNSDLFIQERLFYKYFGENGAGSTVALTKKELGYIKNSAPVTVLLSVNQKPLVYAKDGKVCGLIPDYLDLIAKKTGLRFKYVVCSHFSELAGRFKDGGAMIFAQFPDSYQTAQAANVFITQPFYTLLYGLVTKSGGSGRIKTVAIEAGKTFLEKKLREEDCTPRFYASETECLEAVAAGRTDAAAVSSLSYGQMSYHARFSGLFFLTKPKLNINVCLGVSKNAGSTLYSIIEKGAGVISSSAISDIVLANSVLKPEYTLYDYIYMNSALIFIIAALLLAGLFLAFWSRRERRLNVSLRKAKLEADLANQAKSSFLSCMSHDLRTPLNGVVGFTDLALREPDAARKQEYLTRIKAASSLLADLVEDTLELSRIESGKMTLEPAAVNGNQLYKDIITAVKPAADLRGITLASNSDSFPDENVWTDRLKVQKILLNLLSNAIKYTPQGGAVSITITTLEPPLNGCTRQITVEDNGIGMSKEFQSRLYEPFAQERRPEARNVTGTGLGLAIVKKIVDLMNGSIEVQSEAGKGTKFTVCLPVRRADDVQRQKREAGPGAEAMRGKRVLLCEDNEMNAEIASILLKEKGLTVDTAGSGKEGLEMFSASANGFYDVILMDIRMPVMDGYEATRKIRALSRPDAASVPIIAMSADAFEEDFRRAKEIGMNGYVTKPIDPGKLFETLGRLLKHHC